MIFRVGTIGDYHKCIGLGVVPATTASRPNNASAGNVDFGCWYFSSKAYYSCETGKGAQFVAYDVGDAITVRVDLNTNMLTFRKNGADVGAADNIAHDDEEGYRFAFVATDKDSAVTIVKME